MIPNVYSVGEGLTLRVCNTEKFKAGMLSISAVLPIEQERAPLTSLLLSVLRRGTVKYPSLAAINRRLDYLYGTGFSIRNFYRGDSQIIGFSAELLDNSYLPQGEDLAADVLDLMREILFHPLLDEDGMLNARYVESEKQLQCDAIRALKNNPRAYASEHCRAVLYENEPCGAAIYGTEEQVMEVTPAQLTAYWRALIASMTFDCFYVGNADAAQLCSVLKQTLGSEMHGAQASNAFSLPTIVRSANAVRRVEEELPVGQGQLVIGLRTGVAMIDPQYYACAVLNELLGVSPVSRLFVNVREKLSLCYFCSSHYNAYKGTILIHSGLDRANRERAEAEIFAQLRAVADGSFTDGELDAAKKSIVNAYRQLDDSPAAIESFYFGRALLGVRDSIEHCRACFEAVTRDDVISVAAKITTDTVYFLNGTLVGEEGMCDEENEDD